MSLTVAPAFPNDVPVPVNVPPSSGSNTGSSPASSFKSTYADVQQPAQDQSTQTATDSKGKPVKSTQQRKDPKDPAVVELTPQPAVQVPPLLLVLSPALNDGHGLTNNVNAHDPSTEFSGQAVTIAPDAKPDIAPLPPSQIANQDLAFALRLLGYDPSVASETAAQAKPIADQSSSPSASSAKTDSAPPVPATALAAPAANTNPATSETAALKTQIGAPAATPRVSTKQPVPDESSKGNNTPNSGSEREAAPAMPVARAVDAKYASLPFAEVREIASPSTLDPAAAAPKPLNTNADLLVPLKTEVPTQAATNNISLRLTGPDQSSAMVRVLDRSGEIHVSVHASDPQLANSLRSDVDQLRSHLTTRGWDAEVWKPEAAALKESANHSSSQEQYSAGKRDGQGQGQPRQQRENQSGKRPAWLDELEQTGIKGGH